MATLFVGPGRLVLLPPGRDATAKRVLDAGEAVGGQPQAQQFQGFHLLSGQPRRLLVALGIADVPADEEDPGRTVDVEDDRQAAAGCRLPAYLDASRGAGMTGGLRCWWIERAMRGAATMAGSSQ